jgi:Tc toxin complex TcA C-terminal TcB-binding domain
MATLAVNIIAPHTNDIVGKNTTISVKGSVALQGGTFKHLNKVNVQFGQDGSSKSATISGAAWECTGTVPADALAGKPLSIAVSAQAHYAFQPDPSGEGADVDGAGSVVVLIEQTPPELTVEPFNTEVVPPALPYRITLRGTARDVGSGIASVQFRLGDEAFANVENLSGDWTQWAKALDLPAGEYQLTIQASDTAGNSTSQSFGISVRTPFEPTDVEQAFAPTTYLRELLNFANQQIKIGATGAGPTAQVLAARFFQPFDKLTAANAYEEAVRPVHQARIAVEVLRPTLSPAAPPEVDQRFRAAACQALLRELGTSSEELRLARLADAKTRRTLAARIGIEIEAPRPDRLDQMTFLPDAITDAQLESMFGYRSTAPADPLQSLGASPTFLLWRLGALRSAWQRDDAQTRDSATGALPIIDPDVIDKGNIKTQTATIPAFALWTARQTWIATTLTAVTHAAETQTNPLARFDQIVQTYVGNINLAALAARDANGEDVSPDLGAFTLDLGAFRFLARCRELLVAGTLLESEWQDVYAILLQAQKKSQYPQWRAEERQAGLILEPAQFLPDAGGPAREIPRWRGSWQTFSQWRRTLLARAAQQQSVENNCQAAIGAAEVQTLPGLRDALLDIIGQRRPTPEDRSTTADRLTRELLIDFRANAGAPTTRVNQALETLQGILFSVRSGRLTTGTDSVWTLQQQNFDAEWAWMGSYQTWLAAIRVFAYPENQLFPNLYVHDDPFLKPTQAFLDLIRDFRQAFKVTPEAARHKASDYLTHLRPELGASLPAALQSPTFLLTDQMSDTDLVARQQLVTSIFGTILDPNNIPQSLREVFWLVPIALALRLQEERQYLAALDWFQTIYAFNLPPANRKIYRGLTLEEAITTAYVRDPHWLITQLNPHILARTSTTASGIVGRKNVYTRFTVMAIVRCLLAYADLEFSRNLTESVVRARTLYETAADLLTLPDFRPEIGPFPANPVWESLRLHVQSNLAKIHNGLNIAGVPTTSGPQAAVFLPSQYRYAVLIERAKNLVGIAQQVESAFLSALERRDAETYSVFQANHDIQVARATVTLQDLKVADADIVVNEAELQKDKADIQFGHYKQLLDDGLSFHEEATLAAMGAALALRVAHAFSPTEVLTLSNAGAFADAASAEAQFEQTLASFERRQEEWQLQKNLSDKDRQIGEQQILHAQTQKQVALQERQLAGLQLEHAAAVLDFLANKFTNAELFEWMSGVLGRVYAYFLQQSTAIAQLAQAQLAFERQEPAPGFIRSDYWQDTSDGADGGSGTAVDRQGLTGSARLLEDIFRLDQYAFETDQRKLHLAHTLSLSQIAALELQQFRETGLLVFATPMEMFGREFPGHYLRLIKRVRVSLIALVPPVRGVRATLSASGLSRVIIAGDQFSSVTLSRPPEAIAFTSPLNATGLFEMEPENGLLLPFEGMGVDTVWQLELPKPANPFDYRTIADVLLTIEYTALNSYEYRQEVLRGQDRSFSGDRAFSVRDQFPDAWYELNNPESVADQGGRMRTILPIRRDDFPPHLEELAVQELTLFCLPNDGFTQELSISSLRYTPPDGEAITAGGVRTTGGIIGTRRPNGAPWSVMVGHDPVGEWSIQLEDTDLVRGWFKDGSIQDLVLVVTVTGVTPAWL